MLHTIESQLKPEISPDLVQETQLRLQRVEAYLTYRYDLPEALVRETDADYDRYMCKTSVITGVIFQIESLGNSVLLSADERDRIQALARQLGEITRARRVGLLTPAGTEAEAMRKTPEDMMEIKRIIQEAVALGRSCLDNYSEAAAA